MVNFKVNKKLKAKSPENSCGSPLKKYNIIAKNYEDLKKFDDVIKKDNDSFE